GGLLAFEVGHDQSGAVAALCENAGFHVAIHTDLAGIGRVVAGRRVLSGTTRNPAKKALGKLHVSG
ncbi:MAG TPA: hypothetical protein VHG92_06915, partial [Afifellaceae bacterium]|nr:hypothetical protein [Afifellaceae bacterium]